MAGKVHEASGNMEGPGSGMTNAPKAAPTEKKDADAAVDQSKVTSKVKVDGALTIRTYSDGSVQRLVHENADIAKDYAASVAEQGA